MKFEISDMECYLEALNWTLDAFDSIWPAMEKRGLSKDAAFVGWCMLCNIDFMNAAMSDDDTEDWQL